MLLYKRNSRGLTIALATFLAVAPAQLLAQESPKGAPVPPAYGKSGRLVQELKAFDNPESAAFSADGRFLFVSNAAELGMPDKGFAWTEKAGFVSKLAVEPNGQLKMVNAKLVTGLTAPLGMAVNPVATGKFPQGSIFLCTGGLPLAEASGTTVKDPSRLGSKVLVFDGDGKVLGELRWNAGSILAKASGAPATLPNAIAFDSAGNLFIAETGVGGPTLEPKLETRPGVMMIPLDAIDAVAAEEQPKAKLSFIPMPGGPDGIRVSPADGSIHINTVGVGAGLPDGEKGGMWRLTRADFEAGRLPKAFSGGWGALDGLAFTATGTRLDTQILPPNYVTVVPKGSDQVQSLKIEGLSRELGGPADIAVHSRADGSALLVIPELMPTSPNRNENPVLVVELPAGF